MTYWSSKEIAYLEDHANEGAEAVAKALGRSVSSVAHQAHNWGISLRVRCVCPKCGHVTYAPLSSKTGWCRSCCLEHCIEVARERDERARREVEAEQRRIERLARERQALYSSTNRQRKKLKQLKEESGKAAESTK